MAGKDQHHVWQMIQRGFGIQRGKYHHIWVFTKDEKPKQTTTRKYGSEPNFLTTDTDRSADEVLTDFENATQGFIHDLRQKEHGAPVSVNDMAPFISHLEMRSMFLRQELSRLNDRLFEGIQDIFSTQARTQALLAKHLENNPELIEKELDKLNVQGSDRDLAAAYAEHALPELIRDAAAKMAGMVHSVFSADLLQTTNLVKNSHIRAIVQGFTEIERTTTHAEFEYSIVKEQGGLILPDTGLAFLKPKGIVPISQKDDGIREVVIPIDCQTYVYGHKRSATRRTRAVVNKILASCSFESFIGRENTQEFGSIAKFIGKNARMISDVELQKMLSFESFLDEI